MTRITRTSLNFEREPFAAPWGFKGGHISELWQTVARLEDSDGRVGVGLGTQSVLWCDPRVFIANSESAGNALMHLVTGHAVKLAAREPFDNPIDLLELILPEVQAYAAQITGVPDLRSTFALNALVAVDHAAWQLYSHQQGEQDLARLVPEHYAPAIGYPHDRVVTIPTVGYGLALTEISKLADAGFYVFKIKLGSDPAQDGDPQRMLEWDCQRISAIHATLQNREAPQSHTGMPLYYLDANGRYDTPDRVHRLIDHLGKIGALEQTILLEEPFPEHDQTDVRQFPILIVADESAGLPAETIEKLDQGYGAVALKPAAKTLSVSLQVAKICRERGAHAFCADLTVNPILVDWNKNVAGRLAPLPGFSGGLLETNGFQNYKDWDRLCSYHHAPNASWIHPVDGEFHLTDEFFESSGSSLQPGDHYGSLK